MANHPLDQWEGDPNALQGFEAEIWSNRELSERIFESKHEAFRMGFSTGTRPYDSTVTITASLEEFMSEAGSLNTATIMRLVAAADLVSAGGWRSNWRSKISSPAASALLAFPVQEEILIDYEANSAFIRFASEDRKVSPRRPQDSEPAAEVWEDEIPF